MEAENSSKSESRSSQSKSLSLRSAFFSLTLLVFITGLVIAGVMFLLHQKESDTATTMMSEEVANLMSLKITSQVEGMQNFVQFIAKDSRLPDLFEQENAAELENIADETLKQNFPYVLKLHFLDSEFNQKQDDPVAPISYASIALADKAEQSGEVTVAEIHSPGTPLQHIAIAAPVFNSNKNVVGTVLVAFNAEAILHAVRQPGIEHVRFMLLQNVGETNFELVLSSGFVGKSGTGTVKIDQTIWSLTYQLLNEPGLVDHLLPALIIIVWLILIGVLIFVKQQQLSKTIKHDQEIVVSIVENKLKGIKQNLMSNYALKDNKAMFNALSQTEVSAEAVSKSKKVRKTKPAAKEEAPESNKPAFPSSVSQSEGAAAEVHDIDAGEISPAIFRAYDIRGIVGDNLNFEQAYIIGKAIGTLAMERGESSMLVARDGRASSKDLSSTLIRGLVESGIDVIDIGLVPTPVMYFGTHFLSVRSGVMVTGSHNPAEYNGFKIVIDGDALTSDQVQEIYQCIVSGEFISGEGSKDKQDISADYIHRITEDIQLLKPMKVVLDCGHGVASVVARNLFESLGCDVTTLYCEIDSQFPAHHPDPGNQENMKDLAKAVVDENADLGIAFDGDGDRLGVVDSSGKIILPDRVLMVLAEDVLIRNPGADIIYDVKSTKLLASHILSQGGRPIMWKTGHSIMKLKMKETGALLGGELSGHIFFTERWYGFDDALYAAARLLEVVSGDGRSSAAMFAELPDTVNTPEITVSVAEGMQHKIMAKVLESSEKLFPGAKINNIDGIRAEYPGAWGLIRASNTTPSLVLRFEADDEESLEKVKKVFRALIKAVLPQSEPNF